MPQIQPIEPNITSNSTNIKSIMVREAEKKAQRATMAVNRQQQKVEEHKQKQAAKTTVSFAPKQHIQQPMSRAMM